MIQHEYLHQVDFEDTGNRVGVPAFAERKSTVLLSISIYI